jgi:uncharacterized membrane protein YfcA
MPVYLVTEWRDILRIWPVVAIATVAVVIGTTLGARLLTRLPQQAFRKLIGVLLIALGTYTALSGVH